MKYINTRILLTLFLLIGTYAHSADKIVLSREFNLLTSENLKGYITPLFTSLEESINSNIFTSGAYKDCWSVGLDVSVAGMFIPNSQTTFDAERPDEFGDLLVSRTAEMRNGELIINNTGPNTQPTIYGGHSVGIFASPQYHRYPDSIYKSVGYVEGNNISFMAGLPTIQLILGLPSRTQLRFRFLSVDVSGAPLVYWGLTASQRIDQFFNVFKPDDNIGLGLHAGMSFIARDPGVTATSWAAGAHISKAFDFGVTLYTGFQIEGISGKFEATREKPDTSSPNYMKDMLYYKNSPWKEIRDMSDLSIDITSLNFFKFLVGVSYKTGLIEIHADAGYASQPIVSAGISFLFGQWGNSIDLERELQKKRNKKIKN
jgi:hypothetical protein